MSKEEEFKRSLHDILDSKEISFDENNWEGARQLIDNAKRRKRLVVYFTIPLLLLLIPGALWLAFNDTATPVNDQQVAAISTTPSSTPEITVSNPSEKAKTASPISSGRIPATESPASVAQPANLVAASPAVAPETKIASAQPVIKTATPGTADQQSVPGKTQPAVAPVPEPTVAVKPAQNQEEETAALAEVKAVPATVADQQPVVIAETTTVKDNSGDQVVNTAKAPEEISEAIVPAQPVKTEATKEDTKNNSPEPVAVSPSVAPAPATIAAPVAAPAETPAASAERGIAKVDSAANSKPEDMPVKSDPKLLIALEGGASYLGGWKNPGSIDARGFNPVFGAQVSNSLTDKLFASVGLQYTQVSNLEFSSRVSKTIQYKLTEESDVTVITPERLHYLAVPLKLTYSIDKNNILGLGYNINYLLDVDVKVETYHDGIMGATEKKVTRSSGYTEGFKTVDSQISFLYRRRIVGNLWVNGEAFYGLSDIKNNDFFKSGVYERTSGFRLTLMYTIFKK